MTLQLSQRRIWLHLGVFFEWGRRGREEYSAVAWQQRKKASKKHTAKRLIQRSPLRWGFEFLRDWLMRVSRWLVSACAYVSLEQLLEEQKHCVSVVPASELAQPIHVW